jgi:protein-serine/threonine kinase
LPPEVFDPAVDSYLPRPLDIWALGVTLYAYLFEALPFFSDEELANYELRIPQDTQYSEDCLNLLRGLLNRDVFQRLTIE